MDKIKVYIKKNENNIITEITSSIFTTKTDDYILIDSGEGQRYAHAQNYYFPNDVPLKDYRGWFNYKYIDGNIIRLSESEKQTLYGNEEQTISEQDSINAMLLKEVEELKKEISQLKGVN